MMPQVGDTEISRLAGCDCCTLSPAETPAEYGCAERKTILTEREQNVLRRIREAGERARALKKRLAALEAGRLDLGERSSMEAELDELRHMRAELEEERIAAAEERMRYLGHA